MLSLQNTGERGGKLGHQHMLERVAVFREVFADRESVPAVIF